MPSCFVKGCTSSYRKRKDGVTFHALPKQRKEQWLDAIRRPLNSIINQQRVCSEHFQESDFEILGSLKKIKAGVIPSIKLPKGDGIPPSGIPSFTEFLKSGPSHIQDKRIEFGVSTTKIDNAPSTSSSSENEEIMNFPKDDTFTKWVNNLKLSNDFQWSPNKFVCSLHFRETDFERIGKKCYLWPNVVPSLELCNLRTFPTISSDIVQKNPNTSIVDDVNITEFQCRTCLQVSDTKSSFSMEEKILGRSLKSIILLFIPEMVTSSLVNDAICCKCHEILKIFTHFIERCIEIEGTLKKLDDAITEHNDTYDEVSDSDTVSLPARDVIDSDTEVRPPPQPTENRLGLEDHSYSEKEIEDKSVVICDVNINKSTSEQSLTTPKAVTVNGSTVTTVTENCAVRVPAFSTLQDYAIKPHQRVLTIHPPKNVPQMLSTLKTNGVKVLEVDRGTSSNMQGNRILLFGNPAIAPRPPLPNQFNETLRKFMKKDSVTKVNFCLICEKNCASMTELRRHLQKEHKLSYECHRCGKSFSLKHSRDKHVNDMQGLDNCSYRRCQICSEMVPNKKYFEHVKCHRNIKCKQCGKSFYSLGHLSLHEVWHGANKKKEKQLCPYCGKLFGEKGNLNAHIKNHTDLAADGKHMCDRCPKIFLTSQRLYSHIVKVHLQRGAYECPECKKVCSTLTTLRSHQKLKHDKKRSFVCNTCGEQFARGDYYKRHVRWHVFGNQKIGGVKVYKKTSITPKCKYCEREFANVYLLRQHVIVAHMDSIRYKCRFCSFTFANLTSRHRHEKRHKDPNFELICKICWKRMSSKEALEVHYKKHEMNRRYKCGKCGELLSSKYHFLNHMSEKHITAEDMQREKSTILKDALEEFLIMK